MPGLTCCNHGQVARKPANGNPGLKANRSTYLFCIQMFFTAYVVYICVTDRV